MKPHFDKYIDGLIPAIIQDNTTGKVLMLGYMNEAAYEKTISEKRVVFFSRSKQRLWMKGETSGNFLTLLEMKLDCDNDALLIKVKPVGPVCHTGSDTCFGEENKSENFLTALEAIIADRKNKPTGKSYTSSLFKDGINKIAQKVGEEAVELIIEAKDDNDERFISEAADLMFHLLVLLSAKGKQLADVTTELNNRNHV